MTNEMITAKMELKELVDVFSNLADVKDAAAQGELFTEDGVLEFQMGFDGAIQNIVGREALVAAFAATINPCKAVYESVATPGHMASDCIGCRQCEKACPQHLPITNYLKQAVSMFE